MPRLVFLIGLGVVFALRLGRGVLQEHHEQLSALFPGALDQLFLTPGAAAKLQGGAVAALWAMALMIGATLVFRRRAV